jgi:hypothetical protein
MKMRIILLASFFLTGSALTAQPVLTYETHCLKAGSDNEMSYCAYQEPGDAGENKVWDYSGLEFEQVFTGFLRNSSESAIGQNFAGTNTELTEFSSRFFFNVSEDKIEQYGYSSLDGRIQTHYSTPFVKMKFPFTYGDAFSGSFTGTTVYFESEGLEINGLYAVEADAYGELILPGHVKYDNTLRVRTEKSYTHKLFNSEQEVSIVTYRWYNSLHRYPLLVLTEYTVTSNNNKSTNYQAAYNTRAVNEISPVSEESVLLYPNPTDEGLMLEFNAVAAGSINIRIIDSSGKLITGSDYDIGSGGIHQINLSDKISGLLPSNYLLIIYSGNRTIKKSFTIGG